MPSTYSSNLKLELMATGENNSTWGTKTNNNLGTLLEQAIVGAATVAMADANQSISITDGVSSTGRAVYITCTGALTAARNLTVPTVYKNYVVENATTGGFGIVVKTAAGTGITVAASTKRWVYADGVNVVDTLSGTGPLTVGGALAATSLAVSGAASTGALTATTGAFSGAVTAGSTLAVTGAVTGASFNKVTVTAPATAATLTLGNNKTITISNTLTFTGTDSSSVAFGAGGTVLYASVPATSANSYLGADVAINLANTWFNGPNTGSIGASGQVWLIIARGVMSDTASPAEVAFQIYNGSAAVASGGHSIPYAGAGITVTLQAIVTLSAATTFTLQARNTTTTGTLLRSQAVATTANVATSITAVRLS